MYQRRNKPGRRSQIGSLFVGARRALLDSVAAAPPPAPPAVTWDAAVKSPDLVLSGGNLTASVTPSPLYCGVRSTTAHSAGKFYLEMLIHDVAGDNAFGVAFGFAPAAVDVTANASLYGDAAVISGADGFDDTYELQGGVMVAAPSIPNGTWGGAAVDLAAGKAWFRKGSGAWLGGGDPAAGTGPNLTFTPGTSLYVFVQTWGDDLNPSYATANFGASAFQYAAPAGFLAWDGTVPT